MKAQDASPRLPRLYAASLLFHGVLVATVLFLVLAPLGGRADTAPDTAVFAAILAIPILLTGLPSAVALLSWYLCRHRNVAPSAGHMIWSAGGAAFLLVAIAVAALT